MMALDALVDPMPAAPALSTTSTFSPRRDSSKAVEEPTTPAPMMTASAVVIIERSFASVNHLLLPVAPHSAAILPGQGRHRGDSDLPATPRRSDSRIAHQLRTAVSTPGSAMAAGIAVSGIRGLLSLRLHERR